MNFLCIYNSLLENSVFFKLKNNLVSNKSKFFTCNFNLKLIGLLLHWICIENIFIEINNLKAYNLTLGIFKLLNFKKKYNTINLWLFSSNISTHLFILFANFKEFNVKIFYLKKPTAYIRFIKIIYSLDQLVVKRSTKDFLGKSLYIKILLKKILRISKSKVPILILGESGSGKELIAKTIHLHSLRDRSILNILNCSAIPKTLIESELFGYKQGSFTGAVFDKLGKLEISDKGTLFLDEIGELESSIQIKLLRFLETGEIYPIGGLYSTKVDIKLIFATNKNLNFLVNSGKFRIDFLFRINIVELMIPSLRNRKLDLICLLKIFLINKLNQVFIFKKNILKFLIMHNWRGNIRELKNLSKVLMYNKSLKVLINNLPYNYILYYYIR